MGYWSELMITSRAPRYCFSNEEYNEALRDSYSIKYKDVDNNIIEEKLIPDWFYLNLSYCDVCKKYSKFENNDCSSHDVCVICENIKLYLVLIVRTCSLKIVLVEDVHNVGIHLNKSYRNIILKS